MLLVEGITSEEEGTLDEMTRLYNEDDSNNILGEEVVTTREKKSDHFWSSQRFIIFIFFFGLIAFILIPSSVDNNKSLNYKESVKIKNSALAQEQQEQQQTQEQQQQTKEEEEQQEEEQQQTQEEQTEQQQQIEQQYTEQQQQQTEQQQKKTQEQQTDQQTHQQTQTDQQQKTQQQTQTDQQQKTQQKIQQQKIQQQKIQQQKIQQQKTQQQKTQQQKTQQQKAPQPQQQQEQQQQEQQPQQQTSASTFEEINEKINTNQTIIAKQTIRGYLLTLPNDPVSEKRRTTFFAAWQKVWPEFQVTTVHSVFHKIRGHGVTRGFIKALKQALADNVDIALILEDDAWPFPNPHFASDLEKLIEKWPLKSLVLLLGGHHVHPVVPIAEVKAMIKPTIVRVRDIHGGYAWAIRKDKIQHLIDHYTGQVEQFPNEPLTPDRSWMELAFTYPFYVATPLLIDHHEEKGSFSRTWHQVRDKDPWSGDPKWWKFRYYRNIRNPEMLRVKKNF